MVIGWLGYIVTTRQDGGISPWCTAAREKKDWFSGGSWKVTYDSNQGFKTEATKPRPVAVVTHPVPGLGPLSNNALLLSPRVPATCAWRQNSTGRRPAGRAPRW
jgi:hypothetical protein